MSPRQISCYLMSVFFWLKGRSDGSFLDSDEVFPVRDLLQDFEKVLLERSADEDGSSCGSDEYFTADEDTDEDTVQPDSSSSSSSSFKSTHSTTDLSLRAHVFIAGWDRTHRSDSFRKHTFWAPLLILLLSLWPGIHRASWTMMFLWRWVTWRSSRSRIPASSAGRTRSCPILHHRDRGSAPQNSYSSSDRLKCSRI